MTRVVWVYLLLVYVITCHLPGVIAAKAKKHNQELKQRTSGQPLSTTANKSPSKAPSPDPNGNPGSTTNIDAGSDDDVYLDDAKDANTCPPCAVSKYVTRYAMHRYWNHDIDAAYACACQALVVTPTDNLAKALLLSLHTSRLYPLPSPPPPPSPPTSSILNDWEFLGPINVGMLELDGDPSFDYKLFKKGGFDVASYMLSLSPDLSTSNASTVLFSDLTAGGKVEWVKVRGAAGGQVDLHYPLAWNELAQGVGNSGAVYEYTAWGRTVTYLTKPGSHTLQCLGLHTAYIRNNNITHVLVGDVYGGHSAPVMTSIDLREGLVGIVVVVRASVQRSIRCELKPSPDSPVVFAVESVSDIMEVKGAEPGMGEKQGVLLSPYLSLPIFNPLSQPVTNTFQLEKLPSGLDGWTVREVSGDNHKHTPVAPGQTLSYSLELLPPSQSKQLPLLPCRDKLSLTLLVTPSKGKASKARIDLKCRAHTVPLSMSYLSPDLSVTPLALALPLDFHSPQLVDRVKDLGSARGGAGSGSEATEKKKASRSKYPKHTAPAPAASSFLTSTSHTLQQLGYPPLVTLHGSGIAPLQHAEAYKTMPKDSDGGYVFGVTGYYVLAPGRFDAHNWEGVGAESVEAAIRAVRRLASQYPAYLPPMSLRGGVLSGHSMGGHGAWIGAVSSPYLYSCLSPIGGWVKKNDYSHGNAFFDLDVSTSFAPAQHKAVLERGWGEFDVDQLVAGGQEGVGGGLGSMRVHVRVGSHDLTTHPWFSRRMHRLLVRAGPSKEGLVSYEEVSGKGHWWWDTSVDNDGGVVNDYQMREFYRECLDRYLEEVGAGNRSSSNPNTTDATSGSAEPSKSPTTTSLPNTTSKPVNPCSSPMTVTTINPATQRGHCGVQVLSQHRLHSISRVTVESIRNRCHVVSGNVKEMVLVLSPPASSSSSNATLQSSPDTLPHRSVCQTDQRIYLNGHLYTPPTLSSANGSSSDWQSVRICLSPSRLPIACEKLTPKHYLNHKSLVAYGPIRHVYHRPLMIIYGTPTQQALRIYLKDLAVYLANAIYIAHKTHVAVYSDLEARAQPQFYFKAPLRNVIFIGDSSQNKVLKSMVALHGSSGNIPLEYRFPDGLEMHGYDETAPDESDEEEVGLDGLGVGMGDGRSRKVGFSVGGRMFPSAQHGIVFTFPFQSASAPTPSYSPTDIHSNYDGMGHHAMGICIHANSVQGYVHLTRLAWPVIPPMVRPPFATYLPDYVISGEGIWEKGVGGLLGMGFWDSQWRYDELQASWLSEYL